METQDFTVDSNKKTSFGPMVFNPFLANTHKMISHTFALVSWQQLREELYMAIVKGAGWSLDVGFVMASAGIIPMAAANIAQAVRLLIMLLLCCLALLSV